MRYRGNNVVGILTEICKSIIPFSNKVFRNAILHVFDNLDNFIVRLPRF